MSVYEPHPCVCLLCRPRCVGHVNDDRRVCGGCRSRLRETLADLVDLYAMLEDELTAQGGSHGPRVSGSREAPIPGRLDVLTLLGPGARGNVDFAMNPDLGRIDPKTKADKATGLLPEGDQYGQPPPFAVLESWERDFRSALGWPVAGCWPDLPSALAALVRFLDAQLDWACDHHPAVGDFAAEMGTARQAMRSARGDRPESVFIGRCPVEGCGARLHADTWHDSIRCPACHSEWARDRWVWLGHMMASA